MTKENFSENNISKNLPRRDSNPALRRGNRVCYPQDYTASFKISMSTLTSKAKKAFKQKDGNCKKKSLKSL